MPYAAPRPCTYPGCRKLGCLEHIKAKRREWQKRTDERRGSPASRGYNYQWTSKYRPAFLMEHPLCQGIWYVLDGERKYINLHPDRAVPATVVDHIIPHKGDMTLFWSHTNHQALCAHCHNYKTAKLDGGFGNANSLNRKR